MSANLKARLTTLIFLLPASRAKNFCLRRLSHDVAPSAQLGPNVVLGNTHFVVGADAIIRFGNVFRNLRAVTIGQGSAINQWNWFSGSLAFPEKLSSELTISVGSQTAILSRHIFDCSGGITIGSFTTIAGYRSMFLTHEIDVRNNRNHHGAITVGNYCLVNAANKFVMNATLPDRSVTAIGAVVLPGLHESARLYGGVPARELAKLDEDGTLYFHRAAGVVST